MAKQPKTAISPTREENYPEWYQQVIRAADLADLSPVRGCMVIKPWGWGIWENMQHALDGMFKATGHENAYFPLFIPMSFLEKEAEHVEGFAKECAVVTHHRLEPGPDGGLVPAGELEEPLIVRPTSETIIGSMYAKWVQSHRDLPILINQWANVVRWEMRTRMFLRTAEFLWQEGHTAHATKEEAIEETNKMLEVYADFAENWMAMPVIKGEKTAGERFPGAVTTLTIEAMMQDRKALQSGTSHFLGQNFSKAQGIQFQDQNGENCFAWTTSWGVSTRLIGALIMTHSDDDGLVVPPRLAPAQIMLLPIHKPENEATVMEYCESLKAELEAQQFGGLPIRVKIDNRDIRGGEKNWQHIKRGVPLRVEIGPKDIEKGGVFVGRRDTGEKKGYDRKEFVAQAAEILQEIQQGLFDRALKLREENTHTFTDFNEFEAYFTPKNEEESEIHGGFALCHFVDCPEMEEKLKLLKVTPRCIPLDQQPTPGTCIFTGQPTDKIGVFAKAY
ncbi:MAG: proline--tRNA ligase [Planctomycetaceae bacterium]|nr:proline--tRNA ligase [Planctomycetaceae bacterium]